MRFRKLVSTCIVTDAFSEKDIAGTVLRAVSSWRRKDFLYIEGACTAKEVSTALGDLGSQTAQSGVFVWYVSTQPRRHDKNIATTVFRFWTARPHTSSHILAFGKNPIIACVLEVVRCWRKGRFYILRLPRSVAAPKYVHLSQYFVMSQPKGTKPGHYKSCSFSPDPTS